MKILNYDVEDKKSDYKQKVPFMPDRCFRMLLAAPSGGGKTNLLLDMIYRLLYFDKIYLYKDKGRGEIGHSFGGGFSFCRDDRKK